ncbi:MAG: type VI secretion system protein TssA [Alphaproteobacteria bacterium]|nr:type VI secretion system protein TssA [Alphaproteobacteria bacterium]
MASPPTLDIDALLAPIEGEKPTGIDIREDDNASASFYQMRDLRAEARSTERSNETIEAESGEMLPPPLQWTELAELCEQVLKETTKDFEVACWLIEAKLRLDGFAGLRDSVKLATGLVTQYWDDLHSMKDEEDPGAKGQPIASLNGVDGEGALLTPLRRVKLTPDQSPGPFAYWNCEMRQRAGTLGEAEAVAQGAPRGFYRTLLQDLGQAREAVDALAETLREKMGPMMPPISQIRQMLQKIDEMARLIAGPRAAEANETAEGGEGGEGGGEGAGTGGEGGSVGLARPGEFRTRDQALDMLLHVARFFREREPQSPIAYTLEDLVRRAQMPLADLLNELLEGDTGIRNRILMAAGIKPPEPPTE